MSVKLEVTLERARFLAGVEDYVNQLIEEGLDGLPLRSSANAPAGKRQTEGSELEAGFSGPSSEPTGAERFGSRVSRPILDSTAQLFSPYPGLKETTDLTALRAFIGDCQRCKLAGGRTNLVFGAGNPDADLIFIGEGPGADEDSSGQPFVGRAGQLLTDIIERGMGLRRSDVYICNVVKCRPPGNRNPEPDEVAACEPFLLRQIELVRPRVIVGLGTFAVQTLLRAKTPISKLRGVWHQVRGVRMMPTFHPAYLLRNPGDKRLVWADIQEVMKELAIPMPNRG